jgi:hypothetical protein
LQALSQSAKLALKRQVIDISSHAELAENTLREDNEKLQKKLQKKLSELKIQIEKNLVFEQENENLRGESQILRSVHQTEKEILHKEIQYVEGFIESPIRI